MRHDVAPQISENLGRHPTKALKRLASPLAAARRTVQLEFGTSSPRAAGCGRAGARFGSRPDLCSAGEQQRARRFSNKAIDEPDSRWARLSQSRGLRAAFNLKLG